MRQLNDVVWSLDAHNDTLPQLLDRLRDYAYEVLAPSGLHIKFEVPETLPTTHLSLALRRNLYLIYKETLHNVLKHAAGASWLRVRLSLESSPSRLLLEINNEVVPVLAAHPTAVPYQRRSGHGLRNITQRAVAVGGTAECGPQADGSFRVRVQFPL
ncbi:sensor histidine kinase [Hymenobacter ginkgonis]|uniref:sensor histidine kinase n=1 Tax=Hymenobacter ginkgonis TaxID=2682976 RepID=UPI003743F352